MFQRCLLVVALVAVATTTVVQAAPTGNLRLLYNNDGPPLDPKQRRHLPGKGGGKMWNSKSSNNWNMRNKRARPNKKYAKSAKSSKGSEEGLLDLILDGECPGVGSGFAAIDCAMLPGTTRVMVVDFNLNEFSYCCNTDLLDQEGLASIASFPVPIDDARRRQLLKNQEKSIQDEEMTSTTDKTNKNVRSGSDNKIPPLSRDLFDAIFTSQCFIYKCEDSDDFGCIFYGYEIIFEEEILCFDISDDPDDGIDDDDDDVDVVGSISLDSTLEVTSEFEVSLDCMDEFGDCVVTAEAIGCDPITVEFFPSLDVVPPGGTVSMDTIFSTDDPTLEGLTVVCFIDFFGNGVPESTFSAEITVDPSFVF